MLRDARGTGARGVMGSERAGEEDPFPSPPAITPHAPVPRVSPNMKTTGDESDSES